MKHINLLPWRDIERAQTKKNFLTYLITAIVSCIIVIIVLFILINNAVGQQKARNAFLQQHMQKYDIKIIQIGELRQLREEIGQRLKVVNYLQQTRFHTIRIFDTLSKMVPDGIYLTSVTRNNNELDIVGKADANSQVSQLMRNVTDSSWLTDPSLKVIKTNEKGPQFKRDFELKVKTKFKSLVVPAEKKA